MTDIVKLCVGDKLFKTRVSTLTRYPDSMLGVMFSGKYAIEKDEEGDVFIDRMVILSVTF